MAGDKLGKRVLVTGANGQIGIPLVAALVNEVGDGIVIATDLTDKKSNYACKYEKLDVNDTERYANIVRDN